MSYELICGILKETQHMHNTQTSVWEIQHPSTFYQQQDKVELQGTHLDDTVDILSVQLRDQDK